MKATGIVRRIDDLGRVVIPKEIRHIAGIEEGDPLEISLTKENEVVFRRYEPEPTRLPNKLTMAFPSTDNLTNAINALIDYLKAREK